MKSRRKGRALICWSHTSAQVEQVILEYITLCISNVAIALFPPRLCPVIISPRVRRSGADRAYLPGFCNTRVKCLMRDAVSGLCYASK
jgi:hypothetical protein